MIHFIILIISFIMFSMGETNEILCFWGFVLGFLDILYLMGKFFISFAKVSYEVEKEFYKDIIKESIKESKDK